MTKAFKSLIVLMGLPSSGKSTLARLLAKALSEKVNIATIVIGTDDIRQMFPKQLETFDPNLEPFIKNLTLENIRYCLENNYLVINDDMNYYKSMRHELKQIAETQEAHFLLIQIQIPLETALKWNKKRGLPVPQDVIRRVHERFDEPGEYQWDQPLLTIQSAELPPEKALQLMIPRILSVISAPFEPPQAPVPSQPGIAEKIDKVTREIVATFAQKNNDPLLMKQISKFRIEYLKNLLPDESTLENLEEQFTIKLQEFITHLKQAK